MKDKLFYSVDEILLLAMYEIVHLNRNFMSMLTCVREAAYSIANMYIAAAIGQ